MHERVGATCCNSMSRASYALDLEFNLFSSWYINLAVFKVSIQLIMPLLVKRLRSDDLDDRIVSCMMCCGSEGNVRLSPRAQKCVGRWLMASTVQDERCCLLATSVVAQNSPAAFGFDKVIGREAC